MSPRLLQRYAASASRAALNAGVLLVKYAGRPRSVATKRSAIDLVTDVDKAAEQLIYTLLHRAYPDIGFLGEEAGDRSLDSPSTRFARSGSLGIPPHSGAPHPPTGSRWIVDPIDGTNNFVHGLPLFGVSIALEIDGRVVVGVIYDPMRRELFVAVKGGGARLNGHRIRVSPTRQLSHSLLSTGFSSSFLTRTQPYLGWFTAFQRCSHGVRRLGSTVISLASIAAGRLEGFYERDLWPWDIAAGMLLVEEAGGRVTNVRGGPASVERSELLASNGWIHGQMLRVLSKT